MGLFDSEELPQDDDPKGGVEKSRLFDTVNDSGRSARDYLKVFGVVVVGVIVAGLIVVYFTRPGIGDVVRAPVFLDEAVRAHFRDIEKREVTDATYHLCDGFYWARVQLERRTDITARKMDAGNRVAVGRDKGNDQWEITSEVADDARVPCGR